MGVNTSWSFYFLNCGRYNFLFDNFVFNSENEFFLTLLFAMYVNKDIIGSKSILKRIFGQVVVDSKTFNSASEIKCIIRNIVIILWPLELTAVIFSPNKRIGDYLAGTKVIRTKKNKFKVLMNDLKKVSFWNWVVPVIISLIYSWLLFAWMDKFNIG